MAIKHILARIDGSPADIAVLDYALMVAAKLSAHVDVLHCRFAPADATRLTSFKPKAGAGLDALVAEYANEAALRARDHFDRWLRANELIEERPRPPAASSAGANWSGGNPICSPPRRGSPTSRSWRNRTVPPWRGRWRWRPRCLNRTVRC